MSAAVESLNPSERMTRCGSLLSSTTDLFDMLGISTSVSSENNAFAKSTSHGVSRHVTTYEENVPYIPTSNLAQTEPRSSIGCGFGSNTRTVFVSGNFEGDPTRLGVVIEQSRQLALKAASRGNRVMYAFVGNVMPDVHGTGPKDDGVDSLSSVLDMAHRGIDLSDMHTVAPDDVILLSGARELAWLRLANTNSETRELVEFDSAGAYDTLLREFPLTAADGSACSQMVVAHNDALEMLQSFTNTDELAVAMLLKLVSICHWTMQAPGIVGLFTKRLLDRGEHDVASLASLLEFLSRSNGCIEDGLSTLSDGTKLTPEGIGITPAAKAVVKAVLDFARDTAMRYAKRSLLVHCVCDDSSLDGESGLWLAPRGINYGSIVGKLPADVDGTTLRVRWRDGPCRRIAWARSLNKQFRDFVNDFTKGDNSASVDVYNAYVAMSFEMEEDPLPLRNLSASLHSVCSAVTANTSYPFGTVQRRILVREVSEETRNKTELLKVLDQWTNINTDAYTPSTYWAVATWCESTKRDMQPFPVTLNLKDRLETQLWQVSVTLASLLSVTVQGRAVKDYGANRMSGLLGPVVLFQNMQMNQFPRHKQCMRVVTFTHEQMDAAFVVLLPESFVRWSLDYYNYDMEHAIGHAAPEIATEGFLALPDESNVPLGFPGLCEVENEKLRFEMGTRVWSLPKKRSKKSITSFTATDYAAINAMVTSDSSTKTLAIPGYTIFHTRQSSSDPFAGVHVGLANIPVNRFENRMTIVADSMPSHDVFREVACGTT